MVQVMVQRLLAARSLSHARAGCLLAGALKLLPIWVVLLGMIARVLYTGLLNSFHTAFTARNKWIFVNTEHSDCGSIKFQRSVE